MQALIGLTPIIVAFLATAIVTTVLRQKNAGLTETQLFIRFWKLWTALAVLDLCAMAASIYSLIARIR